MPKALEEGLRRAAHNLARKGKLRGKGKPMKERIAAFVYGNPKMQAWMKAHRG